MTSQAQRIIDRFGGAYQLAAKLGVTPAAVYKWTYPKSKGGRGGVVPSEALTSIIFIADLEGITLTSDDLDPRPR